MPFGHLPYVTLHQGPLNIQQLLTATLAHLRTQNHLRPSQSVPFSKFLFLCVNIYIYIYMYCAFEGGKSLAHLLSCLFFLLSLFWNTFQLLAPLELTGVMSGLIQHLGCSLPCVWLLNELKG